MKVSAIICSVFLLFSCNHYIIRYATEKDIVKEEVPKVNPQSNKSFNYVPDEAHPQATPIRYVRVNFHIMQPADGKGNFSEAAGRQFCRELVDQSNYRWQNNFKMNLPVGNETPNMAIPVRIVLQKDPETGEDAIYFHRDDSLCYWNRSLKKGYASLSDKTVINKYSIGGDTIINIFLMEHDPDSISSPTYGGPTLSGISFGSSIKLFSMYYQHTVVNYRDDGTSYIHDAYFLSKLLNHELGHCFGLNHTWNWDDGCDDTPKNPGCWSETGTPPCDGVISNNIMDYNWCQQAVTPCQIGKIEYSFAYNNEGRRQYAIPYWCEYHPTEKVVISKNENIEWNCYKDLWGDIEIKNGGTLTIRGTVSLPEQAKIIVRPGAKLIIDQGTITNRCGDHWDGIEIWENRKTKEIGEVVIVNKGKVEMATHYKTVVEEKTE